MALNVPGLPYSRDNKKFHVDKDMTSVMYWMESAPIFEQTLGSADAMLQRLFNGDETVGGTRTRTTRVSTSC
ncbi:MAG: hypothetical protein KIT13_10845 [Burkholderiales bacterium]|nr:hypothetical protein [Burkholderiales bacterium]MCW5603725.1 hypothetical protein [Burkholderiales bacterium]